MAGHKGGSAPLTCRYSLRSKSSVEDDILGSRANKTENSSGSTSLDTTNGRKRSSRGSVSSSRSKKRSLKPKYSTDKVLSPERDVQTSQGSSGDEDHSSYASSLTQRSPITSVPSRSLLEPCIWEDLTMDILKTICEMLDTESVFAVRTLSKSLRAACAEVPMTYRLTLPRVSSLSKFHGGFPPICKVSALDAAMAAGFKNTLMSSVAQSQLQAGASAGQIYGSSAADAPRGATEAEPFNHQSETGSNPADGPSVRKIDVSGVANYSSQTLHPSGAAPNAAFPATSTSSTATTGAQSSRSSQSALPQQLQRHRHQELQEPHYQQHDEAGATTAGAAASFSSLTVHAGTLPGASGDFPSASAPAAAMTFPASLSDRIPGGLTPLQLQQFQQTYQRRQQQQVINALGQSSTAAAWRARIHELLRVPLRPTCIQLRLEGGMSLCRLPELATSSGMETCYTVQMAVASMLPSLEALTALSSMESITEVDVELPCHPKVMAYVAHSFPHLKKLTLNNLIPPPHNHLAVLAAAVQHVFPRSRTSVAPVGSSGVGNTQGNLVIAANATASYNSNAAEPNRNHGHGQGRPNDAPTESDMTSAIHAQALNAGATGNAVPGTSTERSSVVVTPPPSASVPLLSQLTSLNVAATSWDQLFHLTSLTNLEELSVRYHIWNIPELWTLTTLKRLRSFEFRAMDERSRFQLDFLSFLQTLPAIERISADIVVARADSNGDSVEFLKSCPPSLNSLDLSLRVPDDSNPSVRSHLRLLPYVPKGCAVSVCISANALEKTVALNGVWGYAAASAATAAAHRRSSTSITASNNNSGSISGTVTNNQGAAGCGPDCSGGAGTCHGCRYMAAYLPYFSAVANASGPNVSDPFGYGAASSISLPTAPNTPLPEARQDDLWACLNLRNAGTSLKLTLQGYTRPLSGIPDLSAAMLTYLKVDKCTMTEACFQMLGSLTTLRSLFVRCSYRGAICGYASGSCCMSSYSFRPVAVRSPREVSSSTGGSGTTLLNRGSSVHPNLYAPTAATRNGSTQDSLLECMGGGVTLRGAVQSQALQAQAARLGGRAALTRGYSNLALVSTRQGSGSLPEMTDSQNSSSTAVNDIFASAEGLDVLANQQGRGSRIAVPPNRSSTTSTSSMPVFSSVAGAPLAAMTNGIRSDRLARPAAIELPSESIVDDLDEIMEPASDRSNGSFNSGCAAATPSAGNCDEPYDCSSLDGVDLDTEPENGFEARLGVVWQAPCPLLHLTRLTNLVSLEIIETSAFHSPDVQRQLHANAQAKAAKLALTAAIAASCNLDDLSQLCSGTGTGAASPVRHGLGGDGASLDDMSFPRLSFVAATDTGVADGTRTSCPSLTKPSVSLSLQSAECHSGSDASQPSSSTTFDSSFFCRRATGVTAGGGSGAPRAAPAPWAKSHPTPVAPAGKVLFSSQPPLASPVVGTPAGKTIAGVQTPRRASPGTAAVAAGFDSRCFVMPACPEDLATLARCLGPRIRSFLVQLVSGEVDGVTPDAAAQELDLVLRQQAEHEREWERPEQGSLSRATSASKGFASGAGRHVRSHSNSKQLPFAAGSSAIGSKALPSVVAAATSGAGGSTPFGDSSTADVTEADVKVGAGSPGMRLLAARGGDGTASAATYQAGTVHRSDDAAITSKTGDRGGKGAAERRTRIPLLFYRVACGQEGHSMLVRQYCERPAYLPVWPKVTLPSS